MKTRKTYELNCKLAVIDTLAQLSQRATAECFGFSHSNVRQWKQQQGELRAFKGPKLTWPFSGKESIPFRSQLIVFMKDVRHEEKVSVFDECA